MVNEQAEPEEVQEETSTLYLRIARRALEELTALPPEAVDFGGPRVEEGRFRIAEPSEHFRHGLICTVFAAAAVEHALKALVLLRITTSQGPERALIRALWRPRLTAGPLIDVVRSVASLDDGLVGRMRDLMRRRNEIVHSQADDWEEPIEGLPGWTERGMELPKITRREIEAALGDVAIAEEAVAALKAARGDPAWNPFHRDRPSESS